MLRWLLGSLALALASPALAADLYQGKTVTVIVGYAPGGGVDASARAITRHLGRFIPGHPNIVVQNMEGAAGIVSLNHLDRRVAPDGLTLAIPGRSWYIEAIVRRSSIGIDPTRLTYIGSPGAVSAAGFVHARTGITTYADLKVASKPVTFGALGATTPTAMAPALLAANGAPVKVVLGYVSTARVLLAMARLRSATRSPPVPISRPRWRCWCRPRRRARACRSFATSCGRPISLSSIWCRRLTASVCRWLVRPACRPRRLLFCGRLFWPWQRTRTTRPTPSGSTCR
jgi:hypothetical protein